jgi:hypothetical protein
MSKIQQSGPKKDLATRVFNNFYFDIAWILFLGAVVRLVWPIRNALLVLWVYGSDAYFHQGIRVIKNKPTIFSNGAASPDLPNMVTGFGVFLIAVLGLSLLLVYALRFYEKHFDRREPEATRKTRILPVIRDIIIVLILLEQGPMVVAMVTHSPAHEAPPYTIADAATAFLLGIAGFTLSGYFASAHRWNHLVLVAFGAWFFCILKGIFIGGSVLTGIVVAIIMAILMGIGGALSCVFKKNITPLV